LHIVRVLQIRKEIENYHLKNCDSNLAAEKTVIEKIFDGKVAIVTSGSFGIGRAAAIAFACRGTKVVVADWIEDQQTLETIKSFGGVAQNFKCDVSNESDVKNMVEFAVNMFGRLDFAFNNAGIEGAQCAYRIISQLE
jgi:NAD(P)-dependent dehydrogenase (short-subunit alcohol dehydrogenase family)